jgi:hypothetical protein
MGCFDSVRVRCPSCGEKVEFQSKAGNCWLAEFTLETAPKRIKFDLVDKSVVCRCGAVVTIRGETFLRVEAA